MRRFVVVAVVLAGLVSSTSADATGARTVPRADEVRTVRAAGAVFYPSLLGLFPQLGGPHFCSGSVVHSRTGDLFVTAAHCVFGLGPGVEFVLELHDDDRRRGVWTATQIYIHPSWTASFDPRHDVAFVRVAPRDGERLEDVVPGRPLGTPRAGAPVRVSGYPMGSGGRPITCRAALEKVRGYSGIHCRGFGAGTSGGPWVQRGQVVGVVGGLEQGGCAPDVEYSTPFGDDVRALYRRAVAGGPGDLVPIGFTANAC